MSKAVKMFVGFAATMGVGYGLMTLTTPTDEQLYERLSPDLKKRVDDARAFNDEQRRKQAQVEHMRSMAEADKPVWSHNDKDPKKSI